MTSEGISMKHSLPFRFIVLLVLTAPTIVCAELGGNASSVQIDQVQMKASIMHTTKTNPNYSVQQIQTPTGVIIKEFVSTTGTVFAVTWQGPLMPNMQQLLGQYFGNYVTAAKTNRGGHNHVSIQQAGGLVLQSSGHMRAFSGIAYIPSLVPVGVTVTQLR
jgi:hypothetical protein